MEVPWIEPRATQLISADAVYDGLHIELGGVPRGAAIVVSGVGRLHTDGAPTMNKLAEHGYESVAVEGVSLMGDALPDGSLDRVTAALELLGRRGWQSEQVGILGYEGGAALAAAAAAQWRLGAAVSVTFGVDAEARDGSAFPVLQSIVTIAESVRTPWLGLLTEDHAFSTGTAIDRAVTLLADRSPVHTDVVVYAGSVGEISVDSANVRSHAVAWDSWQRTAEWFDRQVVPRPTPLAERWWKVSHSLSV